MVMVITISCLDLSFFYTSMNFGVNGYITVTMTCKNDIKGS